MDPRYIALARNLCRYSMRLNKTDKFLLDATDIPDEMVMAMMREARACGAQVTANILHSKIRREAILGATEAELKARAKHELAQMKKMTAYCAIRGTDNMYELSDIPSKQMALAGKFLGPIMGWRINHTKWVVLRWPSQSMAQAAGTSTEAFENFYFDVCTFDYSKFGKGAKALQKLMAKTDKVHIKGPGETDLTFSIKGVGAKPCIGNMNIPDGETYSAPVKTSVNGVIHYNTPTVYDGSNFQNIRLEFKDGKIVKATCEGGDQKKLNAILDSDAGARYVGEFAIGFNPYVREAICDILFDEKIAGSLHFTPGQCYEDAPNGNKSQVHWDLVLIQRKEYGGGEIWFDGKLIRKDGVFVHPALKCLNPDQLLGKKKKVAK